MFWDLIQRVRVDHVHGIALNANSTAMDAQTETRFLKGRIEKLEETVERLTLATMAAAEILRDHFGVAQSAIETKVQEIDLRDGKLDGRLRVPPNDCSQCHHTNAPHRHKCLYCGEPLPTGSGLFATHPSKLQEYTEYSESKNDVIGSKGGVDVPSE